MQRVHVKVKITARQTCAPPPVTTLSRSATKNKTYISNEVDESGADVATTAAEKQHTATAMQAAQTPAILQQNASLKWSDWTDSCITIDF
jgi:hypothetical protein